MNKLIVMVVLVFLSGCATGTTAVRAETETDWGRYCTPGNSCLPDILDPESVSDLKNAATKRAYDEEHARVNRVAQGAKDCMARNQARKEHGLPPKYDCRDRGNISALDTPRTVREGTYSYSYQPPQVIVVPRASISTCEGNRWCHYEYPHHHHYDHHYDYHFRHH